MCHYLMYEDEIDNKYNSLPLFSYTYYNLNSKKPLLSCTYTFLYLNKN